MQPQQLKAGGRGSPPDKGLAAIIDDDPATRRSIRLWLEQEGYRTAEYDCGSAVLSDSGELPAVACIDLGLGDVPALQVLQHLKARDEALPPIVVTVQHELETAVAAMRAGAYDYVTKPLERDRLLHAVRRASERRELLTHVRRLESALSEKNGTQDSVGQSPPMHELAPARDESAVATLRSAEPESIVPLRELERRAIEQALRATRGSVGEAAKLLGIGRATLYRRLATQEFGRGVA